MTGVVGVIGVGNMGGAMAHNLLAQGYTVHVHDIDPAQMHLMRDAGAVIHDCPRLVSTSASLIIIAVVDALQVDQVISGEGGLGPTLTPDHTLMLCPTISPQDVERLAQQIHSFGASVMDAPMSGGPARAQAGTMSLMLACDASVYARHAVVLQVLSNQIFRISNKPGDGAKTKLVNNLLAGINLVGAAEVLVLAERMGLSAQTTLEVMAQSSGQSWIGSDRMTRALAEHLSPLAHMSLLTKDTRLACDAARDAKVHVPLGQQASDIFAKACEAGWRDKDDAALLHFLRQLN